ncbi:MAG: CRTAC1 family protein, partial [Bacteroidales bacterium]|nr:CRTAC1 family protein [Bacteroidales bacterium]
IIASALTQEGVGGLHLYHNDGTDTFPDVSDLLPETKTEIHQIEFFDYNNDGDLDILTADVKGDVHLFRNDGGNLNHYVDMKLVGLRAGSAKNNHFGIGAKVEIRSGDLYQCMVVTKPDVHFGLGQRSRADVIRITWTNGVPQNIFMPDVDQSIIEAQTLKGSCPFLYTWDGEKYVFVKDITWRSALGMPLGIMGGETQYGFSNASDDYIKIPGKFLKPKDGKYSLQVTSELWETIYMDRLELVAVDHKESTNVFVPEQFTPPPFPGFKLYQTDEKIAPVSATNDKGEDVLPFILDDDDVYLSGFNPEKYQGLTEMHSLTIDPGEAGKSKNLILYMKGWIFPTDASINFALSQTESINSYAPVIQVKNIKGEWQTVINNLGFPMGKDKTVIADLSSIFLSRDTRVRIVTNMEIYWDQIFFSKGNSGSPLVKTSLEPMSADLHFRGFSNMYRKGGRYGPHWFDYYDVDENSHWRDLTGNYTRYGNVLSLITESDSRYVISNAGDEMTVEFDAGRLPELQDGWVRDFFIRSVGWVKDGDLNTALGNSVEPLPFHGMKSYPPAENEKYPDDPVYQKYRNEYNTRVVKADEYRNALKNITYNDSSK